jgi:hypothetical protein
MSDRSPPSAPPSDRSSPAERLSLDDDTAAQGLAHLVLTLIKLLHDLLEKQAIRRMERGTLTDEEVERVGRTLQRQVQEIERLCEVFGLDVDDLDLSLGTVQTVGEPTASPDDTP